MSARPILVAGIALASTAVLVGAAPPPARPQQEAVTAATPAPAARTLTVDQLRLLAALYPMPLSDVTFDDLAAAFNGDYGPWVLEDDVYYPTEEPSAPSGLTGLGYFLSDAALLSLVDTNLPLISDAADFAYSNITSYYFEVGGAAALHVALAEATGGPDTPFGQLLQRIFNPDAAGVAPGPAIGARSPGFPKAVESGSPTELPKAQPTLVNVSSVEGVDKDAPVGAAVPDSTTDAPEPGPVKKRPKLNVTKANPLAQLRNEVKSNVNDSVKAVGKAVQKLTGKGAADEAKPTDAKPADAGTSADKKGDGGNGA